MPEIEGPQSLRGLPRSGLLYGVTKLVDFSTCATLFELGSCVAKRRTTNDERRTTQRLICTGRNL